MENFFKISDIRCQDGTLAGGVPIVNKINTHNRGDLNSQVVILTKMLYSSIKLVSETASNSTICQIESLVVDHKDLCIESYHLAS